MVDYNPSGLLERLTSNLPAAFSKSDKTGYSVQLVVQATTGDTSAPQDIAMQGVMTCLRGMNGQFVKVAAEFSSPYAALPYQVNYKTRTEENTTQRIKRSLSHKK